MTLLLRLWFLAATLVVSVVPGSNVSAQATVNVPSTKSRRRRALFVNYLPANTELNQMMVIGEELASRGHDVEFLVIDNYKDRVEKNGFQVVKTFQNVDGEKLAEAARAATESKEMDHYINKFFPSMVGGFFAVYESSLLTLQSYIEKTGRPDVIVASMFGESTIDYAATHDIPLAIVYATSLGSIGGLEDQVAAPDNNFWHNHHDMSSMVNRWTKIWRTVKLIMPMIPFATKASELRTKYGLKPTSGPLDNWKNAAIFHTWSFGIEPARSTDPLTFTIGLLNKEYDPNAVLSQDDQEVQEHLNGLEGGAVFAAFGTFGVLPQYMFDAIVDGIDVWARHQQTHQKAGGLFAINTEMQSDLDLSRVPETVKILAWTNQKMVLNHPNTKAFITHAGQGSIAEALDAQVPMLALPLFGDQPTNARNMRDAGLGDFLHFREEEESKSSMSGTVIGEKLLNLTDADKNAAYYKSNLARQKLINDRSGGAAKAADVLEDFFVLGNLDHLVRFFVCLFVCSSSSVMFFFSNVVYCVINDCICKSY